MKDENKTKNELIKELVKSRQQISKLEKSETGHEQAKKTLHETRDYLEKLFNYANVPIIVWNPSFEIIQFNHAFEHLTGYNADEVIGKELHILFPESSREDSLDKIKLTSGGEYWEVVEIPILRKDGDVRCVIWNSANILMEDGAAIIATIAQGIDITERKQAEKNLRESEEKFHSLSSNALDAIIMMGPQGKITFWNKASENMFGYTGDETIGKRLHTLIVPENYREKYIKAFPLFQKTGQGAAIGKTLELTALRKDGSEFPVELSISPIHLQGQWNAVGIIRDITERKQAEKALIESEQKYRCLFETSAEGILVADIETKVFNYANPAICRILGYSDKELNGMNVNDIHPKDALEHVVSEFEAQARGEKMIALNIPCLRKDGATIYADISSTKAIIDGKECNVGFFTDITERKQAENLINIQRDLAIAISAVHNLEEGLSFCIEAALKISGMDCGGAYLVDSSSGALDLAFHKGLPLDFVRNASHYDTDSASAKLVKTGKPIYKRHQELGVPLDKARLQEHLRAIAIIPIHHNNRVIGCLNIASHTLDEVPIFARSTLEIIATQIGSSITRLKTEKALKESEEKYKAIFENANDAIFLMSEDTFIDCNAKTEEIFGCSREDILRRKAYEFSPPYQPDGCESKEKSLENINTALSGKPHSFEWKHKKLGGTLFDAEVSLNRVEIDGKVMLQAIVRDVSDRKKAEAALWESERRYQELFDSVMEGMGLVDENENIQFCNPAFAEIFDEDSTYDMLDKCLLDYFPDSQKGIILSETEKRKKGESSQYELEVITAKNKRKIIHVSITPRFDENKIYKGAFGSVLDITETKRLQELASQAQRLETAGRIAGQVAHDFNNLLGPMIAYPEMIKEHLPDNHSSHKYLNDIEKAAEIMADINQQLLTLSRRGHYTLEIVNLNDIITQTLEQMPLIPNTLYIETYLSENLMNTKGGSSQILRVISNLISNARDAMQDKGHLSITTENFYVDISVGKYGCVKKGEYAKVTITDTGCGISKETLSKIFDPFFTTKIADRKRGSGLGLSVVHAVMEDHDGNIDLQTTIGQGTSFYLYFPITRESIEAPESDEIVGGSESILVVDDDNLQREVALSLLKNLGYKATVVDSGENALELLKDNSYDLLILDMVMPGGINGAETYRRSLELNPSQKAIIVSGFAETEQVDKALELGAGTFIKKPLSMKAIAHAVRQELDGVQV